jgi:hypothetical protein
MSSIFQKSRGINVVQGCKYSGCYHLRLSTIFWMYYAAAFSDTRLVLNTLQLNQLAQFIAGVPSPSAMFAYSKN